jgi:hypothetical protein
MKKNSCILKLNLSIFNIGYYVPNVDKIPKTILNIIPENELISITENCNKKCDKYFTRILKYHRADHFLFIIFLLFFMMELTIFSTTKLLIEYSVNPIYYLIGFIVFLMNVFLYCCKNRIIKKELKNARETVQNYLDHNCATFYKKKDGSILFDVDYQVKYIKITVVEHKEIEMNEYNLDNDEENAIKIT